MSKKVTIRDVAKMAGVSVATVSYVLNQKKGQKISDATRRKVLQISNLLGYMHSSLVKSLISQKSNNVSFIYTSSDNPLRQAMDMTFFEELGSSLSTIGKSLMIQPVLRTDAISFSDAIVAYNVTSENFKSIGNSNFVPLIGVNVWVNDPLFFQINPSVVRAQNLARESFHGVPFDFLYLPSEDEHLDNEFKAAFPNLVSIDDIASLVKYLESDVKAPVLCYGADIYHAVVASGREAILFEPFTKPLVDKICEALVKTINKTDAGNKSFDF